jgi:hypothetical protein
MIALRAIAPLHHPLNRYAVTGGALRRVLGRTLRELARYWGYKPQKKIFGEFLEFHLTYIQSNLINMPWTVQTNIASCFWRQIIYRYGQRWNAVVWCDQCEKYTLLHLDLDECRILGCSNLILIAEGLFREIAEYGGLVAYLPDGWRRTW